MKKFFNINLFFHKKNFFSANNVYFVKTTKIKKKKSFNLVLEQMNNHIRWLRLYTMTLIKLFHLS